MKVALKRNKKGQTVTEQARAQAVGGYNVWRSWDQPGGIRDELFDVADAEPTDRQARGARQDASGSRPDRAEGDAGRPQTARRLTSGGALFVEPARARVDQPRGQPSPAAPLRRRLAGERQGDQEPAQEDRAVVRDLGQPGRLPVHVRPRAAVAQEPARQQRRRSDHRRRRRRPQPQLRRPLGLRQRGVVAGSRATRPTAARALRQSPRRRRCRD